MRISPRSPSFFSLLAMLLCAGSTAQAQVFIYPRHAGQSNVRYFEFEWRHVDISVGPESERRVASPEKRPAAEGEPPAIERAGTSQEERGPGVVLIANASAPPASSGADGGTWSPDGGTAGAPDAGSLPSPAAAWPGPGANPWTATGADGGLGAGAGGVRLYFYEREREVAERATAMITRSYRDLVGRFNYLPTRTFPYILYSSYQEFLQTNLFPLQEGVLGVTSPKDLKLTLPYFGDDQLFDLVSAHEMAHQFTIQKVRTFTEKAKASGDPLDEMPLWFIEGLAEFYAQRGIDPEAEMLVRDIVVNPDAMRGYVMLDFFEDRPYSTLWTYKAGQVRCAFLEDTYGAGTIQRVLEQSPALLGSGEPLSKSELDFKRLLRRITGDDERTLSAKFEDWIKRRAFHSYLDSAQGPQSVEVLPDVEGQTDALATSADGTLLFYRTRDMDTGQTRLVLIDRRDPSRRHTIASDNVPGIESLHAAFGRNFDVTSGALVYVAESRGRDILHWVPIGRSAQKRDPTRRERLPGMRRPHPPPASPGPEGDWDVSISLGPERQFHLAEKGLLAAYAPALSPDGKRIAFIGLSMEGFRDLYLLDPEGTAGGAFRLTRLTEDVYAERHVSWGPDTIVFSSDATSHGKYNLFRIHPERPYQIERLTTEDRDELDPRVLPDGRVLFVAYNRGRADIHEVAGKQVIRRTDMSTGLFDPSPGPDGGVWALMHRAGDRRPVLLKRDRLMAFNHREQPDAELPREIPRFPLDNSEPYIGYAPKNWELGSVFGFLGGGSQGVYGQVFATATDRLRNQGLSLGLSVLGSLEQTSGLLLYFNQERQLSWGGGPFQALRIRIDRTFPDAQWLLQSYERYYGLLGTVRYPIDRFLYLQGDLTAGGVSYFIPPELELFLALPEANGMGDLLARWRQANQSRAQAELTLRLGYDTLRYHPSGTPIGGQSLLLEGTATYHPTRGELFGLARLDAEQLLSISGRTRLLFRVGAGASGGGPLARQFFLSSFDTLRGVPFGNTDWLLGTTFFFSVAELRVPLDGVIRFFLLNGLEAVAGLDFGGVGTGLHSLWNHRVLDYAVGVNFALGPLLFRLHFARPVDIGLRGPTGEVLYPNGNGDWVTNFSIGLAGLPGFMSRPAGDPGWTQTLMR